jgi:hypothetical protein
LVPDDTTLERAMKNPQSLFRQPAFELGRNLSPFTPSWASVQLLMSLRL